jgi:SAM-dependent methyltransferase
MRLLAEDRMEARAVAVVTSARTEQALVDTRRAFDRVAQEYDRSNAANPLLCAMRARTRAALERAVEPGGRVLNLGCGPGTDDVYFAQRGYRIVAIDASPAMVEEARIRVRNAGCDLAVTVRNLGIDDLDRLSAPDRGPFDAAYSSFGPLNCVHDLAKAAASIAARLRPGGVLVASVIGRVCPWEIALFAARADWRRALVRFRRAAVPVPLEGATVWTRYYSPREFVRVCAPAGFEPVSVAALGLFTPPPYMQAFAGRHGALTRTAQRLDDAVGGWPLLRGCGDHFLAVLRRS